MPIARLLYPRWVEEGLDSHRAFIVKYAMGKDLGLSYHFDNAEVTINVCLGRKFEGGSLYFGSMRTVCESSYFARVVIHCTCLVFEKVESVLYCKTSSPPKSVLLTPACPWGYDLHTIPTHNTVITEPQKVTMKICSLMEGKDWHSI